MGGEAFKINLKLLLGSYHFILDVHKIKAIWFSFPSFLKQMKFGYRKKNYS